MRMPTRCLVALGALTALTSVAATAAQAQAGYVTVTYQGTIDKVYDGSSFTLGEPIYDSVTFNPATLQDHTASGNATIHGPNIGSTLTFGSILTASLSDDPLASMTITIGSDVFTRFDQANYGKDTSETPFSLGVGDFPNVFYLNGAFSGIGGVFIDSAGTFLATDPIAARLGGFDGYDFYIGNDSSDAEGSLGLRNAVFSAAAVPEPAVWMMMIVGFGLIGAGLRRRRTDRTDVTYAS